MSLLAARACAGRCPWRTLRPISSAAFRRPLSNISLPRPVPPPVDSNSAASPPGSSSPLSPPNNALLLFCLSTGLVDSLTFAVSGVWCAFVTGTTVQLGMDLPIFLAHLPTSLPAAAAALAHFGASDSSQRIAALAGFVLGGVTGSRLPPWMSAARCTVLQSALLASASALVLSGTGSAVAAAATMALPHPHITLALISASMALQAVLVQRFATPYATSVAWTSVWLGAVAPGPADRRWKKAAGIATVIAGAALGAGIMHLGTGADDARDEDHGDGHNEGSGAGGSRSRIVERVGWGLSTAAAVKLVVAGIFWRRGRVRRVQV